MGPSGNGVAQDEAATRLCAVIEAGEAALGHLAAALATAEVACVLIAPARGAGLEAHAAGPLVEAAQRRNAAALIVEDTQLARALRADGVHLSLAKTGTSGYGAARSLVGRGGIVGVDAGISRHDAMSVAEDGADYVAFGAPAHLKDRAKARVRRDELVAWWAEIFEAPCVALDVETPEEAEALARAGADFVGLRLPCAAPAAATRELVGAIAAVLGLPASVG
ncbi:MAG TPA: thiamine phosphate synthase [Hyphomicrobiaceae bacterium]|nr:thiamine phosphate synthase [Hyphomicrobiaceae bacterium]